MPKFYYSYTYNNNKIDIIRNICSLNLLFNLAQYNVLIIKTKYMKERYQEYMFQDIETEIQNL